MRIRLTRIPSGYGNGGLEYLDADVKVSVKITMERAGVNPVVMDIPDDPSTIALVILNLTGKGFEFESIV